MPVFPKVVYTVVFSTVNSKIQYSKIPKTKYIFYNYHCYHQHKLLLLLQLPLLPLLILLLQATACGLSHLCEKLELYVRLIISFFLTGFGVSAGKSFYTTFENRNIGNGFPHASVSKSCVQRIVLDCKFKNSIFKNSKN